MPRSMAATIVVGQRCRRDAASRRARAIPRCRRARAAVEADRRGVALEPARTSARRSAPTRPRPCAKIVLSLSSAPVAPAGPRRDRMFAEGSGHGRTAHEDHDRLSRESIGYAAGTTDDRCRTARPLRSRGRAVAVVDDEPTPTQPPSRTATARRDARRHARRVGARDRQSGPRLVQPRTDVAHRRRAECAVLLRGGARRGLAGRVDRRMAARADRRRAGPARQPVLRMRRASRRMAVAAAAAVRDPARAAGAADDRHAALLADRKAAR